MIYILISQGLYEQIFLYISLKAWFDGIVVYCSDGNTLYKYNATMLTYLVSSKPHVLSETIHQIPRTHLDEFLAFTDNDQ